jgi:hypothetical protein
MSSQAKIAIIFYSMCTSSLTEEQQPTPLNLSRSDFLLLDGHVAKLAEEVKKGVESTGAKADVFLFPESEFSPLNNGLSFFKFFPRLTQRDHVGRLSSP